ncbi:hypothetical protein [Succinivibrio sp.]|uniref:hypothetical protein n=1 Tax=Succinivibrio sp. TaxID=2053619 RepID=UPI002590ED76|nr:hypothetical protein [Succinivibrio sp.]MDD6206691.1 hypothetical protein [Succinivibrio sp.]
MIRNTLSSLTNALKTKQPIYLNYVDPDDIVMLAAFIKKHQLQKKIISTTDKVESYLDTIRFYKNVWNEESYNHQHNSGRLYCPLIELDSPIKTDTATTTINEILENLCGEENINPVIEVIGELIDNVWSHGKGLGYVVAQVHRPYIMFAIADTGMGFKKVLNDAHIEGIHNDIDAINWCIKEGHTSKGKDDDEWIQRLPFDCLDNPYSDNVQVKQDEDNHHEGLGLFKLVDLVQKTDGYLSILSGHGLKLINKNNPSESELEENWQGVVIYCYLNMSNLHKLKDNTDQVDIDAIIKELLG